MVSKTKQILENVSKTLLGLNATPQSIFGYFLGFNIHMYERIT